MGSKHVYLLAWLILKVRLTGWCGRRWNKLGERMAGAKKRRKMKLLTAVYRTSWSTREQKTNKQRFITRKLNLLKKDLNIV